jgi:hypothetical protein
MPAVPAPTVTCRRKVLAFRASNNQPLLSAATTGCVQMLRGNLCDIHRQTVPIGGGGRGKLVGVENRELLDAMSSDQLRRQ